MFESVSTGVQPDHAGNWLETAGNPERSPPRRSGRGGNRRDGGASTTGWPSDSGWVRNPSGRPSWAARSIMNGRSKDEPFHVTMSPG